MQVEIPPYIWAKVEEAARKRGIAPAPYVTILLAEALGEYEVSGFADENDTPISAEEAAPLLPGTLRGLKAEAEGRFRPAADVFRDIEAKYGLRIGGTSSEGTGKQ